MVKTKRLIRSAKGSPPAAEVTIHAEAESEDRLQSENNRNVPMQLNIPWRARQKFRIYAAIRQMELSALFVEIWEEYQTSKKLDAWLESMPDE